MMESCKGKSRACPLTLQGEYRLQQTQAVREVLSHVTIIRANT